MLGRRVVAGSLPHAATVRTEPSLAQHARLHGCPFGSQRQASQRLLPAPQTPLAAHAGCDLPAWLLARKRLRWQRFPTSRSSISREPSAVCTALWRGDRARPSMSEQAGVGSGARAGCRGGKTERFKPKSLRTSCSEPACTVSDVCKAVMHAAWLEAGQPQQRQASRHAPVMPSAPYVKRQLPPAARSTISGTSPSTPT